MTTKYDLLSSATTPITLRVIPELAEEIGLNASLVLTQLTYWIRISDNERDGKYWTYQSLRGMKRSAFPFWSLMTIDRAITQLIKRDLIFVRDDLNKRKGDNTRWFALNPDGLAKLHSVSLQALPMKRSAKVSQIDTPQSQVDTGVSQIGTTLPEITPETSTSEKTPAPELPDHAPLAARSEDKPAPQPDGGAKVYAILEAYCDAWDVVIERYRKNLHVTHLKSARQYADLNATPDELKAMIAEKRAAGKQMDDYPLVFAVRDYVAWKAKQDKTAPVVADEKTAWRAAQKARANVKYDAALDMLLPAFKDEDDRRRYITEYLNRPYLPYVEEAAS